MRISPNGASLFMAVAGALKKELRTVQERLRSASVIAKYNGTMGVVDEVFVRNIF